MQVDMSAMGIGISKSEDWNNPNLIYHNVNSELPFLGPSASIGAVAAPGSVDGFGQGLAKEADLIAAGFAFPSRFPGPVLVPRSS
jgi:hypothetical protein